MNESSNTTRDSYQINTEKNIRTLFKTTAPQNAHDFETAESDSAVAESDSAVAEWDSAVAEWDLETAELLNEIKQLQTAERDFLSNKK